MYAEFVDSQQKDVTPGGGRARFGRSHPPGSSCSLLRTRRMSSIYCSRPDLTMTRDMELGVTFNRLRLLSGSRRASRKVKDTRQFALEDVRARVAPAPRFSLGGSCEKSGDEETRPGNIHSHHRFACGSRPSGSRRCIRVRRIRVGRRRRRSRWGWSVR